jgi:hypothetical protein
VNAMMRSPLNRKTPPSAALNQLYTVLLRQHHFGFRPFLFFGCCFDLTSGLINVCFAYQRWNETNETDFRFNAMCLIWCNPLLLLALCARQ